MRCSIFCFPSWLHGEASFITAHSTRSEIPKLSRTSSSATTERSLPSSLLATPIRYCEAFCCMVQAASPWPLTYPFRRYWGPLMLLWARRFCRRTRALHYWGAFDAGLPGDDCYFSSGMILTVAKVASTAVVTDADVTWSGP